MTDRPLDFQRLRLAYNGKSENPLKRLVTRLYRARVPGGWLVATSGGQGLSGVTFYPDPRHEWDGGSLP